MGFNLNACNYLKKREKKIKDEHDQGTLAS
jgi:hypothetical protein